MTPDIGEYMYDQLGRVMLVIELPTAGHHPMLDVPLILITAPRSLLADWDHFAAAACSTTDPDSVSPSSGRVCRPSPRSPVRDHGKT